MVSGLLLNSRVNGFKQSTRGFRVRDGDFRNRGELPGVVGDEVRAEEIERQRQPENPSEVPEAVALLLPPLLMQEPHPYIEPSIPGGSAKVRHLI